MNGIASQPEFSELGSPLLRSASQQFGLGVTIGRGQARGEENPYYLACPVRLTRNGMSERAHSYNKPADPLFTLLPEMRSDKWRVPAQTLVMPYAAFVVGQYGVGKTELIHQIGAEIERSFADKLAILPVALADCRTAFDDWRRDGKGSDPMTVLFGHVLTNGLEARQLDWLARAAGSGNLIVALDAADELVEPAAYVDFLGILRGFFDRVATAGAAPEMKLRLVVTTRLDVLHSSGDSEGRQIVSHFRNLIPAPTVYFMRLDVLSDDDVADYLDARLVEVDVMKFSAIGEVLDNVDIMHMLQRPLHARIFCDLCKHMPNVQAVLAQLKKQPNAAKLLQIFVQNAPIDPALHDEQNKIQGAKWDPIKLADRTAQLYKTSRQGFDMDDIKSFIELAPDDNPQEDEDVRYLFGLHKCPFLIVDSSNKRANFSHRIFFEYFTALGLWRSQERAAPGQFPLFDEIVLNIDMRKLLKGIVISDRQGDEEAWYRETRHSYGLGEVDSWERQPGRELPLDDLDSVRRRILDIMTEADDSVRDRFRDIERFFELMTDCFHPRYAVFNYEGIMVYIYLFKFERETIGINRDFPYHLRERLDHAFRQLRANVNRRGYELMVERILSVSLRLGYDWIEKEIPRILSEDLIKDQDVKARIHATIDIYDRAHLKSP